MRARRFAFAAFCGGVHALRCPASRKPRVSIHGHPLGGAKHASLKDTAEPLYPAAVETTVSFPRGRAKGRWTTRLPRREPPDRRLVLRKRRRPRQIEFAGRRTRVRACLCLPFGGWIVAGIARYVARVLAFLLTLRSRRTSLYRIVRADRRFLLANDVPLLGHLWPFVDHQCGRTGEAREAECAQEHGVFHGGSASVRESMSLARQLQCTGFSRIHKAVALPVS